MPQFTLTSLKTWIGQTTLKKWVHFKLVLYDKESKISLLGNNNIGMSKDNKIDNSFSFEDNKLRH